MMSMGGLEDALSFVLRLGALGAAMRNNPGLESKVIGAVREQLRTRLTPEGVRTPASVWIATARAP
jgi:hypothetical protein